MQLIFRLPKRQHVSSHPWREPIKHLLLLLFDDEYRQYYILFKRYGKYSKYTGKRVKFNSFVFDVPDVESFIAQYRDIMLYKEYRFKTRSNNPVIIDLGANVGLSVFYFITEYPNAVIEAYEADPEIYEYLSSNIHMNIRNSKGIKLINRAAWDKDGVICFIPDGADGGYVSDHFSNCDKHAKEVNVIDAKKILEKYDHIDMLKIDIEGAEYVVIKRVQEYLSRVNNIFIEYHSSRNDDQKLADILQILKEKGFRVYIKSYMDQLEPLISRFNAGEFDMCINIYAYR